MTTRNITTLSLITATIIGLNGCGGGNSSSSSSNNTDQTSKITLKVSDASAGFLKEDVELNFSGIEVSDAKGKSIKKLSLLKNTPNNISLYIKTPPATTKDLRIVADSDQYLATGTSLLIRPTQRDYAVNLKMVEEKVGKVTQGVFMNELDISSMVDATGKVTEEITLESNPGADISTKIKIPVNTILLDEDGNPIVNATLKVTSFDPSSPKALQAYPGGLNVMADATGFNGATGEQEINFKTAGFVAIEIAGDNDKRVKTFSQDVEVAMQFKVGTTDGDGKVIAPNDAVPIWSYDENTGKWTYEEDGTAVLNSNDSTLMDVVYNITHLSYYNLDWHYGNVCSANINVIDNNNINALNSVDHFTVNIPGANLFRTVNPWGSTANGDLVLYNVPSGYQGTVTAYDANGIVLGSVGPTDLCGGAVGTGGWTNENYDNEVDLTIDDNTTTDVNVSMTFSCPNNVNIPGFNSSTVPFSAVLTNAGNSSTQLTNGTGTLPVSNNGSTTYDITATSNQSNLFAVIDPSNSSNPTNNQITLNSSNTNVTQDFVLTNAFCNPTSGTINGSTCTGTGTNEPSTVIGSLGEPVDVAKDSNGNVYISTWNNGILKRDASGTITTFIAQGTTSMPSSNPSSANDEVSEITIKRAQGLDLYTNNGQEHLVYVDRDAGCVNVVELSTNRVLTVAGQCGLQGDVFSTDTNNLINATDGKMQSPADVAIFETPAGSVGFIADPDNGRIYMVSLDGNLWSVAGTGTNTASTFTTTVQNALTTNIRPSMLDVDSKGKVIFSEALGHSISSIDDITYFALSPFGNSIKLKRIAGNNTAGNNGDGTLATNARLYSPMDIEIDTADNIFIADRYNHKVRRIDNITAIIDTVAGTGNPWGGTSCGLATQQRLHKPFGLWIEDNSDFYLTQFGGTGNLFYNALRHVTY